MASKPKIKVLGDKTMVFTLSFQAQNSHKII